MSIPDILILPAANCRRSRIVLEFLRVESIPFHRIDLGSDKGKKLRKEHQFLASPGILVDGVSINPMDILDRRSCRVVEDKALALFSSAYREG